MPRKHIIYIYDEDPVTVDQVSEDGIGIRYTGPDGSAVRVPWIHVTKICSYRVPDAATETVYETDDDTDVPADPDAGDSDQDSGDGKTKADWPEADNATMRTWAQTQGLAVSASGPVSNDVKTAYAAAHVDGG